MIDNAILNLLSGPVRRYVRDQEWEDFRPIQKSAIVKIMTTDENYILASSTASGKTEAAFLPVLSKVNFDEAGVQVLYISPLIALINDQLERVVELCRYIDVPVTKWHGEASLAAKMRLEKDPRGVMLTTPESLEAMFVHHPERIRSFFGNLKFVVVDEIHYFIGSDRGLQLQSLLSRIRLACKNRFRLVGLSATIGNPNMAKEFFGNPAETKVLLDKNPKPIDMQFRFYEQEDDGKLPIELVRDIFRSTYRLKALIFPNSRRCVEELAVRMKRFAEKSGTVANYFAHHASVDKKVREEIEQIAKRSEESSFAICCTSTLELGIDIGSVDTTVQVNSLYSIASMIQRAGRSGRQEGAKARMIAYSTEHLALMRSIACWNLHKRGIIESPDVVAKPYDVLAHQIVSIVSEKSETDVPSLFNELRAIHIFDAITKQEIATIVKHLIKTNILEVADDKIIVGTEGEKLVRGKEFYSMFTTPVVMSVYYDGSKIGELQQDMRIYEGYRIFLSARVWEIIEIDLGSNKVFVKPAASGKAPMFKSESGNVPEIVEREVFRLLCDDTKDDEFSAVINKDCVDEIKKARADYSHWKRYNMFVGKDGPYLKLMPLFGTRINLAILTIIRMHYKSAEYRKGLIYVTVDEEEFMKSLPKILEESGVEEVERWIAAELKECPVMIDGCSKFGGLLPVEFQAKVYAEKMLDIDGGMKELRGLVHHLYTYK